MWALWVCFPQIISPAELARLTRQYQFLCANSASALNSPQTLNNLRQTTQCNLFPIFMHTSCRYKAAASTRWRPSIYSCCGALGGYRWGKQIKTGPCLGSVWASGRYKDMSLSVVRHHQQTSTMSRSYWPVFPGPRSVTNCIDETMGIALYSPGYRHGSMLYSKPCCVSFFSCWSYPLFSGPSDNKWKCVFFYIEITLKMFFLINEPVIDEKTNKCI